MSDALGATDEADADSPRPLRKSQSRSRLMPVLASLPPHRRRSSSSSIGSTSRSSASNTSAMSPPPSVSDCPPELIRSMTPNSFKPQKESNAKEPLESEEERSQELPNDSPFKPLSRPGSPLNIRITDNVPERVVQKKERSELARPRSASDAESKRESDEFTWTSAKSFNAVKTYTQSHYGPNNPFKTGKTFSANFPKDALGPYFPKKLESGVEPKSEEPGQDEEYAEFLTLISLRPEPCKDANCNASKCLERLQMGLKEAMRLLQEAREEKELWETKANELHGKMRETRQKDKRAALHNLSASQE